MKERRIGFAIGVLALALALGCGSEDAKQTADDAQSALEDAGSAMEEAGADAMDQASEAADSAGEMARDAAGAATESAEDAAAAAGLADPAKLCTERVAAKEWAAAIEPCTRAHAANPDDVAIEHALQQAKAGAAGT